MKKQSSYIIIMFILVSCMFFLYSKSSLAAGSTQWYFPDCPVTRGDTTINYLGASCTFNTVFYLINPNSSDSKYHDKICMMKMGLLLHHRCFYHQLSLK